MNPPNRTQFDRSFQQSSSNYYHRVLPICSTAIAQLEPQICLIFLKLHDFSSPVMRFRVHVNWPSSPELENGWPLLRSLCSIHFHYQIHRTRIRWYWIAWLPKKNMLSIYSCIIYIYIHLYNNINTCAIWNKRGIT